MSLFLLYFIVSTSAHTRPNSHYSKGSKVTNSDLAVSQSKIMATLITYYSHHKTPVAYFSSRCAFPVSTWKDTDIKLVCRVMDSHFIGDTDSTKNIEPKTVSLQVQKMAQNYISQQPRTKALAIDVYRLAATALANTPLARCK